MCPSAGFLSLHVWPSSSPSTSLICPFGLSAKRFAALLWLHWCLKDRGGSGGLLFDGLVPRFGEGTAQKLVKPVASPFDGVCADDVVVFGSTLFVQRISPKVRVS